MTGQQHKIPLGDADNKDPAIRLNMLSYKEIAEKTAAAAALEMCSNTIHPSLDASVYARPDSQWSAYLSIVHLLAL
jgi:hypothetical protein